MSMRRGAVAMSIWAMLNVCACRDILGWDRYVVAPAPNGMWSIVYYESAKSDDSAGRIDAELSGRAIHLEGPDSIGFTGKNIEVAWSSDSRSVTIFRCAEIGRPMAGSWVLPEGQIKPLDAQLLIETLRARYPRT